MTTLYVPLHMPVLQSQNFLQAELSHRDVKSVKIINGQMVITHERKPYVPPQSICL